MAGWGRDVGAELTDFANRLGGREGYKETTGKKAMALHEMKTVKTKILFHLECFGGDIQE